MAVEPSLALAPTPKTRCAIYTRKSTDEGLDSGFSSLDAQRAACSAFIISQQHDGWVELQEHYDDGGFSGGNLERPAFQRLLNDVRHKRVDVVVVYKVDRLTRSLLDFARIIGAFEENAVSFVSITQSLNSTTSMGWLTLNVLLSFAQFERELASERVRDKIAASKQKGLWVGGTVPLGYDNVDRKLIINPIEADLVRHIFNRYCNASTGRELVAELARDGVCGKARRRNGSGEPAKPISLGALYAILQNRTYIGEVAYRGAIYPGVHEAIVARDLFETVGRKLAQARVERKLQKGASEPSMLSGLIKDHLGRPMVPTHTQRGGRRYRYYCSQDRPGHEERASYRISATELERLVIDQVRVALAEGLEAIVSAGEATTDEIANLQVYSEKFDELTTELSSMACRELIRRVVTAISIGENELTIFVRLGAAPGSRIILPDRSGVVAIRGLRRNNTLKVVMPCRSSTRPAKASLVELVRKAFLVRRLLETGTEMADVATQFRWHEDYVVDLARVALLSPSVITALVAGDQPSSLSTRTLMYASKVPLCWSKQRQLFGF